MPLQLIEEVHSYRWNIVYYLKLGLLSTGGILYSISNRNTVYLTTTSDEGICLMVKYKNILLLMPETKFSHVEPQMIKMFYILLMVQVYTFLLTRTEALTTCSTSCSCYWPDHSKRFDT